jgi:hypothetical protein
MHVLRAFDVVFVPWTYCALDLGQLPAKKGFSLGSVSGMPETMFRTIRGLITEAAR